MNRIIEVQVGQENFQGVKHKFLESFCERWIQPFWVVISSIISAIGVIIVGSTLSVEEMDIVSVAFIAPNIIEIIPDLGINHATIKYTAQYRSEHKLSKVKQVLAADPVRG